MAFDTANIATLGVRVTNEGIDETTAKLDRLGSIGDAAVDKLTRRFLEFATAAGVIAAGMKLYDKIIDESSEAQYVIAQVTSAIKSTGGAAGVTARELEDLAKAMQQYTQFSDEAVLSASSIMLTFDKIADNTFPRAIKAAGDLAARMGEDISGAAFKLGMALNDPAQGLTRLRRSGIQFTDAQKELIKSLQDSGDLLGAQGIILDVVERKMAGAAAAARDTLGGAFKGLKNDIGDVFEFTRAQSDEWIEAIRSMGEVVRTLGKHIGDVVLAIQALALWFTGAWIAKGIANMLAWIAVQKYAIAIEEAYAINKLRTAEANAVALASDLQLATARAAAATASISSGVSVASARAVLSEQTRILAASEGALVATSGAVVVAQTELATVTTAASLSAARAAAGWRILWAAIGGWVGVGLTVIIGAWALISHNANVSAAAVAKFTEEQKKAAEGLELAQVAAQWRAVGERISELKTQLASLPQAPMTQRDDMGGMYTPDDPNAARRGQLSSDIVDETAKWNIFGRALDEARKKQSSTTASTDALDKAQRQQIATASLAVTQQEALNAAFGQTSYQLAILKVNQAAETEQLQNQTQTVPKLRAALMALTEAKRTAQLEDARLNALRDAHKEGDERALAQKKTLDDRVRELDNQFMATQGMVNDFIRAHTKAIDDQVKANGFEADAMERTNAVATASLAIRTEVMNRLEIEAALRDKNAAEYSKEGQVIVESIRRIQDARKALVGIELTKALTENMKALAVSMQDTFVTAFNNIAQSGRLSLATMLSAMQSTLMAFAAKAKADDKAKNGGDGSAGIWGQVANAAGPLGAVALMIQGSFNAAAEQERLYQEAMVAHAETMKRINRSIADFAYGAVRGLDALADSIRDLTSTADALAFSAYQAYKQYIKDRASVGILTVDRGPDGQLFATGDFQRDLDRLRELFAGVTKADSALWDYYQQLLLIDKAVKDNTASLEAQHAATMKQQNESYAVRLLRAQGNTKAAEDLAFAQSQANERADLVQSFGEVIDAQEAVTLANYDQMAAAEAAAYALNTLSSSALNAVSGYKYQAAIFQAATARMFGGGEGSSVRGNDGLNILTNGGPSANATGANGTGITLYANIVMPNGDVLTKVVLKGLKAVAQRQLGDSSSWNRIQ